MLISLLTNEAADVEDDEFEDIESVEDKNMSEYDMCCNLNSAQGMVTIFVPAKESESMPILFQEEEEPSPLEEPLIKVTYHDL